MTSSHTTTPPLDQHGAAFVLAVLSAMSDTAAQHLKTGRDIAVTDYFKPGDRVAIPDPDNDDLSLGSVWRTKPKPVAEIVDHAALLAWCVDERPDDVEDTVTVVRGRDDEIVQVLEQHAPHLLTAPTTRVTEQGQAAVLRDAIKKNADPIPGVEVRTPRGNVTVKLDDDGAARIRELVAAGKVDPLRALPAAKGSEQ